MMKALSLALVSGVLVASTMTAPRAQAPAASSVATTDIYHVHFTKAAPGQADALGKTVVTPDKTTPMPDHFIVFRHQEGDDWDYAVIQHYGPKAELTTTAAPGAGRDLRAWHEDTFAIGPSWADFSREMGLGGSGAAANMVYVLGAHRQVPGQRDQLLKALTAPAPQGKVQTGTVLLQHMEGGNWTFLTITRYNSWQDFATDRAQAAAAPGASGGWADIRQHSAFHRDTIADRIHPMK